MLLTAKAEALMDSDVASAKVAALEANRLLPEFTPAAIVAAKVLLKQNDLRKGSKILETAWRAEPHPDLADLYVHARPADAVLDRLGRARKLQEMKKNHAESSLAVARAALDAQDFALAREEAEAAARMQPSEGTYLLLADIEEADGGNQGKVRQLLSQAVRAPHDAAWVADGVTAERWAPISPVTGRLDAFEWRGPVERAGRLLEASRPVPNVAPPSLAGPERDDDDVVVVDAETLPVSNGSTTTRPVPAADPDEAPHQLDDPGVGPDDEVEKPRRFRLF